MTDGVLVCLFDTIAERQSPTLKRSPWLFSHQILTLGEQAALSEMSVAGVFRVRAWGRTRIAVNSLGVRISHESAP